MTRRRIAIMRAAVVFIVVALVVHGSTLRAQAPLTVDGDVPSPRQFALADLQQMPRLSTTVVEAGALVRYEGVAMAELLTRVGAPTGEALRGPALAHYVVAEGADGYRAVFGITEGDPDFSEHPVIVADRRDGQPLSAMQGPLRLIVPADTRPTRSVRMLVRLTVHRVDATGTARSSAPATDQSR